MNDDSILVKSHPLNDGLILAWHIISKRLDTTVLL